MTLLQRLVGGVLAVLFLLAVLVFASLALGILLAVGLVAWGWMGWRSRSLRNGRVIEGEYRRLHELDRQHQERDPQRL
jgi:hypothetical protein